MSPPPAVITLHYPLLPVLLFSSGIQWNNEWLHSWRGVAEGSRGRGGDATTPRAGRGSGRSWGGDFTYSRALGGSTDTVSSYVGRAWRAGGAPEWDWGGGGCRPPLSRGAGPPADLRVSVRWLRELRSADGRQSSADRWVRRCRPYGWVVRPLISLPKFDNTLRRLS